MLRPAIEQPELLPLAPGAASRRIVLRCYRFGDGAALFAALAPHRDEMQRCLSDAVGAPVSIKGRRAEGMGALGRREGIACWAVALITRREAGRS